MRRRVVLVVVFLLAGAVVNVGVAWGCALFVVPLTLTKELAFLSEEDMTSVVWQRHGATRRISKRPRQGNLPPPMARANIDFVRLQHQIIEIERALKGDDALYVSRVAEFRSEIESLLPQTDRQTIVGASDQPASGTMAVIEDTRGWPMLSLRCVFRCENSDGVDQYAMNAGFLLRPSTTAVGIHPWLRTRMLPYRLVWPGFILNTLSYAALLWLLVCGPFTARRLVHIRRGLCPACAYPMGESDVCTECGLVLSKSPRSRT